MATPNSGAPKVTAPDSFGGIQQLTLDTNRPLIQNESTFKRIEVTSERVVLAGPFNESEQTFLLQEAGALQLQLQSHQRKVRRARRIWQALNLLAACLLLLAACLLLAGTYQTYEIHHTAVVKSEQLNRVAAVVKPLGFFSRGQE